MQMITQTFGVLQPSVLNYGIHSGPSSFQRCVNLTYARERTEGKMKAFVDDCANGTGSVTDVKEPLDENNKDSVNAYHEHLMSIAHMLLKAIATGFRFKLAKAYFAQILVKALGFLLGLGTRSLDPDKVQGILDAPRSTKPADTDSYLGGTSFLRGHCGPEFPSISKPLRSLIKSKLEREGWTGPAGKGKVAKLDDVHDCIELVFKEGNLVPVAEWKPGKQKKPLELMRSGGTVWHYDLGWSAPYLNHTSSRKCGLI